MTAVLHATSDPEVAPSHPREAQIFPRLHDDQVKRLRRYGHVEHFKESAALFERGERSVDFFVVLEGSIELLDEVDGNALTRFRQYGVGEFTGELHLFNDRAVLITGRAAAGSRLLRVGREQFRHMVSTEADVGEIVMRAFILRRMELIATGHAAVTIVGSAGTAETHRVREFLSRNAHPYRLLDVDVDTVAAAALPDLALTREDLPLVLLQGGAILRRPTLASLAVALGISEALDAEKIYDVAVVGAGPAGLAASVYAASEGLSTIVVEGSAPGGQAGTSSRIENYIGFPTGISGHALAGRAQVQAQKFGARLAVSRQVVALDCSSVPYVLTLEDGERIAARTVVIATGARYRRLNLPGYERFEGRGIYYAATQIEAQLCAGRDAVVVGGGNSAGQAAVFLSRTCRHVHVLVRSEGLAATMSDYLVQRLQRAANITVRALTEISSLEGEDYLSHVTWSDRITGESERRATGALFVMIGADPNTDWLRGCIPLDAAGFVLTGRTEDGTLPLSPYATGLRGVFAVGDVRSDSVKRVASSVGEGSVVISAVHRVLQDARSDKAGASNIE
ncbi:cyclic nucleotide-binding domain-containing thioredoxin-disulfide reductase [Sphingomonas sp. BK069]|uniref:FAD-dependent oxidoreductase n=1 Tax=Sphingomonas sp. BK069 TaxID=2586979 RepID=UPI001607FD3F|nr:cyclic nucleotide-binding domain-containing thioredoxin-disulfide reductase [Sphingomonas sp. BK069]MBB3348313.1 thioredoxin reductase (NADPH) [Sphingomonas sp. BK069]